MINRRVIVEKHNPLYNKINKYAPLSVGNGSFCFTADFTGLQSFFDEYSKADDAFPLCTMADWGWHSYPIDKNKSSVSSLRQKPYDTYGRTVYYPTDDKDQEEHFKQIRINTHKFHLGKIGFEYSEENLLIENCEPVKQLLSLWEGILYSEFKIQNKIIKTQTFIHPYEDTLYIQASSLLLKENKLKISIKFPYGSHKKTGADFQTSSNKMHITKIIHQEKNISIIERNLDDTVYKVTVKGKGFSFNVNEKEHLIYLIPDNKEAQIEFSISFEPLYIKSFSQIGLDTNTILSFDEYETAIKKCKTYWENFWNTGGFIDFSESNDKRALELERRIILSQYLIAIQSRGKTPPAETGLSCNSWYGKFHLEMHFWHHAHWAFWKRTEELKKSFEYYKKILPLAKGIAESQAYKGARFPKMCDPTGENTPSSVAVLLIWQQVHPIMFAELCWREAENDEIKNNILNEYLEIIIETSEFMKSFLHWDGERYVLGPPYIPVQERHDPVIVLNAAFELEYFRWGFCKADEWLKRLGKNERYGEIIKNLSLPPLKDGVYLAHENCPETFTSMPFYTDHPSMLMIYGVLDSDKIDHAIMSATLDKVLEVWDKKTFYGWDFPMMAMTSCRLGRYKDAVDLLLMESPKNTWLENGHNKMTGDNNLPLYLPGNGSLLLAVAMMAAGYGNKNGSSFPEGFTVKVEGISKYF